MAAQVGRQKSADVHHAWESAALAEQDATGLLPRDGVLYLFSSLRWGDEMEFRFIHRSGETKDWAPLRIPDDLPEAWGKQAPHSSPFVSPHVPVDRQRAPRLLPCWPFTPVAIKCPAPEEGETSGDGPLFWRKGDAIQEVLIRAQDPDAQLVPEPVRPPAAFARPFEAFPHDWATVRVVAAEALKAEFTGLRWKSFAPDADAAAQATMMAAWRAEALALYEEAIDHPPGGAIPQHQSDALWERMRGLELLLFPFSRVVTDCVNASLGLGSEGVVAIPRAQIDAGKRWHSLGYAWERDEYEHEFAKRTGREDALQRARAIWRQSQSEDDRARLRALDKDLSAAFAQAETDGELARVRDVWAPTPNRMLGAPSYVQGDVETYVTSHVLLLELKSSDSLGLILGDGVLQFMIRPGDLSARRFDRVKVICSSY